MGNAEQRKKNTTGWNGFMSIGIPVILGTVALILILNAHSINKAAVSGVGTGGDNDEPSSSSSPTPGKSSATPGKSSATPDSDLQETYARKRKKRRY